MKVISEFVARHAKWVGMAAVVLVAIGVALMWMWPGDDKAAANGEGEREILYWVAPMDPSYRRDEPGKSPMGMDLVPVYAGEKAEPGVVRVSPAMRAGLGVRLGEVVRGDLDRLIDTVGRVEVDEARRYHVHLRTSGWIERLHVRTTGELVEQGQPLFEFYSPELVAAQEEFVQTLRGGISRQIAAARERLVALGVPENHIDTLARTREVRQTVTMRAHHGGGIVEELNAADGMRITPGDMPIVLADLSEVWVIADVFESQAAAVAAGQPVEIRLPFAPGQTLEGTVDYVYPTLDRTTRTLPVRMRFANDNGHMLKPGMVASVRVHAPAREGVLSVPREALIRTGRQQRVVTVMDDGGFRVVQVRAGIESGERVEILEGLEEGRKVVVSGQFLIDSASDVAAEAGRLEQDASEMDHDHDHGNEDESSPEVSALADLHSVDVDAGTVRARHDPIPEIGWPEMTMDFDVAPGVELADFDAGDAVRITIREQPDGSWQIIEMKLAADDEAGHDHNHGDDRGDSDEHQHDNGPSGHDHHHGHEGHGHD